MPTKTVSRIGGRRTAASGTPLTPGTKIKLGIKRDGKDMTVEVTVGKRSEIFPPKDKD